MLIYTLILIIKYNEQENFFLMYLIQVYLYLLNVKWKQLWNTQSFNWKHLISITIFKPNFLCKRVLNFIVIVCSIVGIACRFHVDTSRPYVETIKFEIHIIINCEDNQEIHNDNEGNIHVIPPSLVFILLSVFHT